jgi:hypothetical protein
MNDKELDAMAEVIGKALGTTTVAIFQMVFVSLATMVLWNRVVPDVFGLDVITFAQSVYLSAMVVVFSFAWRH